MPIIDRRSAAIVSMIVVVLALAVAIPPFIDATGEDSSKTFTQTEGEDLQLTGTLFADLTDVRGGQSFTEAVSIHTTETDFNGAVTLSNVTIEGTGGGSYILFDGGSTVDGFEDDGISEYGGDTSDFSTQSSVVKVGSVALEATNSNGNPTGITSTSGLNSYPEPGDTFSLWIRTSGSSDEQIRAYYGAQSSTSFPDRYMVDLNRDSGMFRLFLQNGGTTTLASDTQSYADNQWYRVEVEWDDSTTPNTHTVTLYRDGSQINQISAQDDTHTSGGIGWQLNTATGGTTVYFDQFEIVGQDTGTYIGETHSVNGAETGFSNVTLSESEVTIVWEADTNGDGTFETTVSQNTRTTTGNYTVDLSDTSGQNFRVNVTFNSTGDTPTAELHDEGILTTTTEGVDVNVTLVDTETGQTVDTGPINESETRQFTIGMETVTVTNEDVLSGSRSLMTYEYPTYYGMDGGVKTLVSNAPLIALALGFIIVVMALYAGRGV